MVNIKQVGKTKTTMEIVSYLVSSAYLILYMGATALIIRLVK
jgi:hypothetical protein